MDKIFVVFESTGEYEDRYTCPIKAFINKADADKYAEKIEQDIANIQPAIDENIWDLIEWEAYDIMDDNYEYQNNVSLYDVSKREEWDHRQKVINSKIDELYISLIKKHLPNVNNVEELYNKQKDWEDMRYTKSDFNGAYVTEIELVK